MDIASLSPFDTSSRYTFLGSIASQFSSSIILNDGYSNIFSKLLAVARTPLMGTPAGAALFSHMQVNLDSIQTMLIAPA